MLCVALIFLSVALRVILHQSLSLWVFNALVLIFLGGMIVLFLYIRTLSNNDKLVARSKTFTFFYLAALFLIFLIITGNSGFWLNPKQGPPHNTAQTRIADLSSLYDFMSLPHLAFMISLLLATLFCTVKLTEGFKGSLTKGLIG